MQLPQGYEKMSPVELALEVALHELTVLNGLRVTDILNAEYTWEVENEEVILMLERTLQELRVYEHKDKDEV